MGMTIVRGFQTDVNEKTKIKTVLKIGIHNYYPDINYDCDSLVSNILMRLQVMLNLPLELVVKNLGREIDLSINMFYKMYVSDIGIIIADRIVQELMILDYVEFKENKVTEKV